MPEEEPTATVRVQTPEFAIDVGDIPVPGPAPATDVGDNFDYPVAFKLAFVGVGQAGARICETFSDLGYRRLCAINTTEKDLAHIKIPPTAKLVLSSGDAGRDGAGKDPTIARAAIEGKEEEVYDLIRRNFGDKYDWAFVCFGCGGGTGAGAFPVVAEVAKKVMEDLKLPTRVGAIVALPKNDEGNRVAANALHTAQALQPLGLSPIIIIDNEKIKEIYPKTPAGQFWGVANKGVATLLHLFNRISAQSSPHTTFDPADFASILASGIVAFGATALAKYDSQADISKAIRQQLQDNILASVDLSKGTKAGCIFVGSESILNSIPQEYLDHGFEMLTRLLADGSTVHRGIYPGSRQDLRAYTMIGGLQLPEARLKELAKVAG